MPTEEILNQYTLSELRKEIEKAKLKGYNKLKKKELITLMMTHKEQFHHLTGKKKKPRAKAKAKPKEKT